MPSLGFIQAFVGSVLIGSCMNRLAVGVLYGTALSVHSVLPGNSRSIKIKNWILLVVKLGTLDGVPAPIEPEVFPLYLRPAA
jgi:hypothetical protein